MENKIRAFISYKREDGGMSRLAEKIRSAQPSDIDVNIDYLDAEKSKHIEEFIDQIKTTPSVVFLLSNEYFESVWCMGELIGFLENFEVGIQGYFISCSGWLGSPDNPIFNEDAKSRWVSRWERRVEDYPPSSVEKEISNKITNNAVTLKISDQLHRLKAINYHELDVATKTPIAEFQSDEGEFKEPSAIDLIWSRFREVNNRVKKPALLKSKDGCVASARDHFESLLSVESGVKFSFSKQLKKELIVEDSSLNETCKILWNKELREAINILYIASKKELDGRVYPVKELEEFIPKLLSLLMIRGVSAVNREAIVGAGGKLLDATYFDIAEDRKEIPELLMASMERNPVGRFEMNGSGEIVVDPKRQWGWDIRDPGKGPYTKNSPLDREALNIWNKVFRKEQILDGHTLNVEDWGDLRQALEDEYHVGNGRYYIVDDSDPKHPLQSQGIASKLKFLLPFVFTFRLLRQQGNHVMDNEMKERHVIRHFQRFEELFSNYQDTKS